MRQRVDTRTPNVPERDRWLEDGLAAALDARWADAIAAYRRALALDPRHADAWTRLGFALAKSGRKADAAGAFLRALRTGEADGTVAGRYWAAVAAEKLFGDAARDLPAVFRTFSDPTVGVVLARALERLQRDDEARDVLNRVLELDPDHAVALTLLGTLEQRLGRPEDAVPLLQRAVAHGAGLDGELALAEALTGAGDPRAAVQILEAARRDRPNTAVVWEALAASYEEAAARCAREAGMAVERLNGARAWIESAPVFRTRWDLMDACAAVRPPGLVLEFGVASGRSIRHLAQLVDGTVYGFDSFEGLPVSSDAWTKGQFAQSELPETPENVELVVGWFDKTLPPFLQDHPEPVGLLHIDCDLYVSTRVVLELLADRLQIGTVVVFDELWRFKGWENEEWRALEELLHPRWAGLEFIGQVEGATQAAIRLG